MFKKPYSKEKTDQKLIGISKKFTKLFSEEVAKGELHSDKTITLTADELGYLTAYLEVATGSTK